MHFRGAGAGQGPAGAGCGAVSEPAAGRRGEARRLWAGAL